MFVESLSIKGLFEPEHQSRWPHLGPIAILLSILPIAILLSILPIAILLSILPSILPSFRSPILKSHSRAPVNECWAYLLLRSSERWLYPRGRSWIRRRAASRDRGGVAGVERRRRKRREAASFKRLSL